MAKKIEISGNYTIITDTVSSDVLFEAPTFKVRFRRISENRSGNDIMIYADGARSHHSNEIQSKDDVFVDSGDVVIADIYDWLIANTGV